MHSHCIAITPQPPRDLAVVTTAITGMGSYCILITSHLLWHYNMLQWSRPVVLSIVSPWLNLNPFGANDTIPCDKAANAAIRPPPL